MPQAYEDRCLWMRTRYEYKTLAIVDYPDEALAASTNPFAVVLLVAKQTLLQVRGTEEDRDNVLLDAKLRIVRLLKERMEVFGERKTRAILTFLKNYVVFKKSETNRNFMEQTDQLLGKSKTMGIFEQLAEIKHQEGVEEGIQIGKQEGVQEGLENAVRSLFTKSEFSPEKIAELVGVPIELVEKVKAELSTK
jgi:predicted transposase YdaD